jgi:DNA-binding Xre family transcriptional regulator
MVSKQHIKRRGGMAWKVSVSPVKEKALAKGIKNPRQLALRAHINKRTASRWWKDDPKMLYIDKPTLLALAICLECEPGELITKIEVMD